MRHKNNFLESSMMRLREWARNIRRRRRRRRLCIMCLMITSCLTNFRFIISSILYDNDTTTRFVIAMCVNSIVISLSVTFFLDFSKFNDDFSEMICEIFDYQEVKMLMIDDCERLTQIIIFYFDTILFSPDSFSFDSLSFSYFCRKRLC
jgi:hypothetical protein